MPGYREFLSIGWLYFWRLSALSFAVVVPISVILTLTGIAESFPATQLGIALLSIVVQAMLFSPIVVGMILRKRFRGFRVVALDPIDGEAITRIGFSSQWRISISIFVKYIVIRIIAAVVLGRFLPLVVLDPGMQQFIIEVLLAPIMIFLALPKIMEYAIDQPMGNVLLKFQSTGAAPMAGRDFLEQPHG